jgi:hypothetical protein
MTRDDIVRMAREAGLVMYDYSHPSLERFAKLVAEAEREACAAVCDRLGDEYADANPADCASAIRERGAS